MNKLKSIYELYIVGYKGFIKLKQKINFNKHLIFLILLGFIIIYFLSNLIFSIEIVTNDKIMENRIIDILDQNGIKKYRLKKDYKYIQYVKEKILNEYKESIEWIEIENIGTKYIVRYEPRIILEEKKQSKPRHIIAAKDAIIYDVNATSGEIIRTKNDYVKKGDIVISGYVYLNENIKDTVSSEGNVYGEVWYEVTVSYPLKYYEKKETGNKKNIVTINILNKEIELFNFNKFKNSIKTNNIILKNNLLPFSLNIQKQKEIKIIDENNTEEEAIDKAIKLGKEKINENLNDDEFILNYKILNKSLNSKEVTLKLFFSVCENITDYQEISEGNDIITE